MRGLKQERVGGAEGGVTRLTEREMGPSGKSLKRI